MPTTKVGYTAATHIAPEFFGDFVGDFDTNAVQRALHNEVQALAEEIVPSVVLCADGDIIADVEDADAARDIDWRALVAEVDMTPILDRNRLPR